MAQDEFLTILNDIISEFMPLFAFLTVPFLLIISINLFTSIVRSDVSFSGITSSDKKSSRTKKRKTKIRPNEFGEFDYDYSNNNYECEGCR